MFEKTADMVAQVQHLTGSGTYATITGTQYGYLRHDFVAPDSLMRTLRNRRSGRVGRAYLGDVDQPRDLRLPRPESFDYQ